MLRKRKRRIYLLKNYEIPSHIREIFLQRYIPRCLNEELSQTVSSNKFLDFRQIKKNNLPEKETGLHQIFSPKKKQFLNSKIPMNILGLLGCADLGRGWLVFT